MRRIINHSRSVEPGEDPEQTGVSNDPLDLSTVCLADVVECVISRELRPVGRIIFGFAAWSNTVIRSAVTNSSGVIEGFCCLPDLERTSQGAGRDGR
jgi:hypothetical protein